MNTVLQRIRGLLTHPWAPFADLDDYVLAKWLNDSVGQTRADEFLKLPVVCLVSPHLLGY